MNPLDYGHPDSAYAKPTRLTLSQRIGVTLWRCFIALVVVYLLVLIVGGTTLKFGWWTID